MAAERSIDQVNAGIHIAAITPTARILPKELLSKIPVHDLWLRHLHRRSVETSIHVQNDNIQKDTLPQQRPHPRLLVQHKVVT